MRDSSKPRKVSATEFKAHCLRLMDEVEDQRAEFVVTRHGRPVAKLVPYEETPPVLFGLLRGTVSAADDLISPTGGAWDADA